MTNPATAPRPVPLPLQPEQLPNALRSLRRFVAWSYTWRQEDNKAGRWDKPPYVATAPSRRASSTDPSSWRPLSVAIAAVEDGKVDGLGIALGAFEGAADITGGNRLAAIDLDHCIVEADGTIAPWAEKIVKAMDTYTEKSPSGRGLRLLFLADGLPDGGRKRGNFEIYNSGRYVTLTGHHLAGTPLSIEERTIQAASVHADIFERKTNEGRRPPASDSDDREQADLISRAQKAANGSKFSALWAGDCSGYPSHSEADSALCLLLAFWTSRDSELIDRLFRQSGLMRPKWDEQHGTCTYGQRTVERAVGLCSETYADGQRTPGVAATLAGASTGVNGVRLEDFYAYLPTKSYLFEPTRETWPTASVNSKLPRVTLRDATGRPILDPDSNTPCTLKPTAWLDRHRSVEQITWTPGQPLLIRDRLVCDGGWIERPGCTTFNLYRPPIHTDGNPDKATLWLAHIQRVYPEDTNHILRWLAHRVQRPGEKINHALVLGGPQGIGKDSLLEPVKHAVGPWNFVEVSPNQLLGRFNGFCKSVILRVSEARDLGDVDRYGFYDHLKVYAAAPPDVLRVDEKNLREHAVWNVCGIILTTNYKIGGLYLPADDRRHYIAWTDVTKEEFAADYFTRLYEWYENGGREHVAAYLQAFDLTDFNPKAPPPKTAAFWDLVDADRAPEDAELADALDRLGTPPAVTISELAETALTGFAEWLRDRKNSRQVPHRMETAGYVQVRNECAKDGLWKLNGRRQVVYVRKELGPRERLIAAHNLGGGQRGQ